TNYRGGSSQVGGRNRNWQSDRPLDPEVELSKEIVRILRHGKFGKMIPMDTEGYVFVVDILKCKPFRERFPRIGLVDIQHIVESNNKKRFVMKDIDGEWKIKAAQGHSIQVANLELTPITDASKHPVIVHGTYWENWDWIKEQGLHRMQRSHIHFAEGLPGKVISGMRQSSQVSIYLDLEKALNDGLKFFQSSNKVVLTEGDIYGRIHPKYFKKVEDCR
uniref:2'-phosphotransferase n=1 Tax=Ciona savignyi TaxID=51511 RepID=H2YMN6_CIOSA